MRLLSSSTAFGAATQTRLFTARLLYAPLRVLVLRQLPNYRCDTAFVALCM
jgi:hypothetical protein